MGKYEREKPQSLNVHDMSVGDGPFMAAVLAGLSQPQKELPCKYFYDRRGSRLFEEICELEEYYPTRTEIGILADCADQIAQAIGPRARLVEFGAGASVKVRYLLDALIDPEAFVPVDISGDHLLEAAKQLAADYPEIDVIPVIADYTHAFELPPGTADSRAVGFFPGSTIGNFEPDEAQNFLALIHDIVGPGGGLVIGVDLMKDAAVLEAAYDDARGVTADFNKNLLARINRELGGNFQLDAFRHEARVNQRLNRVEMHLESVKDQLVNIDGESFAFTAGETIHTENSHKYTVEGFHALASKAKWQPVRTWVDADRLFSIHLLSAA